MSNKSASSLWSQIPKFGGDIKDKNKKTKGTSSSFKNFKNLILSALESEDMDDFINDEFELQAPVLQRPGIEREMEIAGFNTQSQRRAATAAYEVATELWKLHDEKKAMIKRCAVLLTLALEPNSDAETAIMGLAEHERSSPKHIWAELEKKIRHQGRCRPTSLERRLRQLKAHGLRFRRSRRQDQSHFSRY